MKIFVDTADLALLRKYADHPLVRGVTTNPSLARKAGIQSYPDFIREVLALYPDRPVSLEVVADDHPEMYRQAKLLSSFGENVYVKIPARNSQGEAAWDLIDRLGRQGVRVNCTAVMDYLTISAACAALDTGTPAILSVFAGRISDSGRSTRSYMRYAVGAARQRNIEVLWASTREIYNVVEADECNVDIITLFPSFLDKLPQFGRDLQAFEQETSKMFFEDAKAAGYVL